ncbi:hypothetical protein BITS_1816 [Bifidobacterium tsurumiense]|uniref:Uncharacterized protein n=1 Tax=Bifidobacterium tsurumiense TaxID=356829 RepID=A0A087ED71_9BIFI|nr:hypothetical protein BITS_1816 [Bifidobacterium tsurumiense]
MFGGDGKRIMIHHVQSIRRIGHEFCDRLRQSLSQWRIDFDSGDPRSGFKQGQRQRSESGSHLDNVFSGLHPGFTNDATHGSGVDNKILAELLGGGDTGICSDTSDIRGAQQVACSMI